MFLALNLGIFFLIKNSYLGLKVFALWLTCLFLLAANYLPKNFNFPLIKIPRLLISVLILIFVIRGGILVNDRLVGLHGDEAIVSRNALGAFAQPLSDWELLGAHGGTLNLFPGLWYYFQGAIINFLGPSLFSIKLLSLITDFFNCLLIFFIVKNWKGKNTALGASLIYATFPIAVHFGMTGYQNVQPTTFLLLTILFLEISERNKKEEQFWLVLSGIASGLAFYFYLSSLVIPLIIVSYLIKVNWSKKKKMLTKLFLWALGLSVTLLPYGVYSTYHYNLAFGRSNIYSFLSQGDLIATLVNQTRRFLTGFYPGPMDGSGLHYLYLPAIPHFSLLVLFFLGLIKSIKSIFNKDKTGLLFILIIFFTSVFGGILAESPPAAQRLIHLFPVIASLIAWGIKFLTDLLSKLIGERASKFLFWVLVLFSVVVNVFSFCQDNLVDYQKLNKEVVSLVEFYRQEGFDLPVYFDTPIHIRDQIFFYSRGEISPTLIGSTEELLSLSPPYLLLTDKYSRADIRQLNYVQLAWGNNVNMNLFYVSR